MSAKPKHITEAVADLGVAQAVIGHNNPPPPEPTVFEAWQSRINDLYDESLLWLDGAKIDSQELADGVSNLKATIQKDRKAADASRDEEKRPFLEAGREVDAKYKPILSKADLAIDACKKALTPWLQHLADEQARIAREAREKADREREAAQAAIRASDQTNLAERQAAEELLAAAKKAEQEAARAEKAKPLSGGAVGRRDGLVTTYTAVMIDRRAALGWACQKFPARIEELLQTLANEHCRFGEHSKDELPGFRIDASSKVR